MRDELDAIHARGAELCVVGSGQPMHAVDFRDSHDIRFPLLVDPELEAYAAAGLRRDLRSSLNLKTLGHGLRALRHGHRQGKVQGDPWQQGGAFVIAPPDRVLFAHVSEQAGDHPEMAQVLEALDRV